LELSDDGGEEVEIGQVEPHRPVPSVLAKDTLLTDELRPARSPAKSSPWKASYSLLVWACWLVP
jgi:hypothetical protein